MAQASTESSPTSQLPPAAAEASALAVRTAIAECSQPSPVPSSSVSTPPSPDKPTSDQEKPTSDQERPTSDQEKLTPDQEEPPANPDQSPSLEDGEIPSSDPLNDPLNPITVFTSQTNFNVKHPLFSTWTLWFDNAAKPDKAKNWDNLIQKVMLVESVEEFWGLYNNIVPPSLIPAGSNYYLFKEGIRPAWEDPANSKGGSWCVQLARDRFRDAIDTFWLYTMLASIGETFETPYASNGKSPSTMSFTDEVTGVVISSRKAFFRISIWTRSADSEELALNIGKHFKHGVLGIPEGKKIPTSAIQTDCEFKSHADSQARKKKPTWTV